MCLHVWICVVKLFFQIATSTVLPRDATHKRGLCRHAVSCLSVHQSVTFVYSVETNKHICKIFKPSGSHTILVFPYQMLWQYSDGYPSNGASNACGVGTIVAILDEYLAVDVVECEQLRPSTVQFIAHTATHQ